MISSMRNLWNKRQFISHFEMTDTEFIELKNKGRIGVSMFQGREVIDMETIYLPSKYKDKIEKLR